MDDPIYSYFHENLAIVSKEELLQALKNALESANFWRKASLLGSPSVQSQREGMVGIGSDLHKAK
jgi:hypothetical protein